MPLIVEHAMESDLPRLMEIQFNAFAREPYHHVLFPGGNNPEARDKAAKRIWKDVQDDPTDNILKCTDTTTGEILTYGKWNVYDKERTKEEYDKHDEVYWCDGVFKEACEEFLHKVHGMRHKAIGGQRHLCGLNPCWWPSKKETLLIASNLSAQSPHNRSYPPEERRRKTPGAVGHKESGRNGYSSIFGGDCTRTTSI